MENAGYELAGVSIHFSEDTGDLILGVDVDDPPPSEQTPEMLAQSEECILEVNGGVRASTVPTTLPEGIEGDFTLCMREAGYEVFDVEIEVSDSGASLSFGHPEPVPEEIVQTCQDKLGIP